MTRAGIDYVRALLASEEEGTVPRSIAERVWVLSMKTRDEVLEYLTSILAAEDRYSRAWDIAADLVYLMGVTGAAA